MVQKIRYDKRWVYFSVYDKFIPYKKILFIRNLLKKHVDLNARNLKGDKMIFSWKEIKTAFNEKVVNGTDAKEVTLGVLEVVGKSLVAGTTEIAKTAVNQVMDEFKGGGTGMASKVYDTMDNHERKMNEIMNDPNSSQEQRSLAQAKLEELSKKKDKE